MSSIEYAYARFSSARFPLPSDGQVAALEARLCISLPEDYRKYLLEYNGGFFIKDETAIVPIGEEFPWQCLREMAGIGATDSSAELGGPGVLDPNMFDDNDPPQVLPIGWTTGNHLIFLIVDPGSDDHGEIGMKIAHSDLSYYLADGIEEFFALLAEPPTAE